MIEARALTRSLGGDWHGDYGLVPGPGHSPRDRSVKVWDTEAGVRCHSFAGDRWQDVRDAWKAQGLLNGVLNGVAANHGSASRRDKIDEDQCRKTEAARRIWRNARPNAGTVAETYLCERGLHPPFPPTLRFAHLTHRPTGLVLPAMIGAVQQAHGGLSGVHRTFLRADGAGKSPVSQNKMMLGQCAGGAVRLAPVAETLAISEGLETGLAVQQATGMPTWATLSTSGLKTIRLPAEVRDVVIAADGDRTDIRAAEDTADRLRGEGRKVRIAQAPAGLDFNDLVDS